MHLYLHVPFCVRRCSYCDFSIAVRKQIPAHEYLEAIRREVTLVGDTGNTVEPALDTIYLGGGTPSLLPPNAIADLLGLITSNHAPRTTHPVEAPRTTHPVEVTLEANPEDVTAAAAVAWRRAGINRVSLGAQSFDDGVLRWMHRSHDAAQIGIAVATVRAAGFTNISLDLIFALPRSLRRDWSRDLEAAIALDPEHLSLYGLTIEERTPLARWVSRGATRPPDDDRYAAEYLEAHRRLAAAGYEFYEVSNAARNGQRSRHNSAYWSGRAYRGFGPAAHSFDGHARRWNIAAWEAYRRAVAAGRSPIESQEVLTPEQRELERVYLGLRTISGLPSGTWPADRLAAMQREGWVTMTGDRVRCTPEGWLRLDTIVSDLTTPRATS